MVKCFSRESHGNGRLNGTVSGGDIPENQATQRNQRHVIGNRAQSFPGAGPASSPSTTLLTPTKTLRAFEEISCDSSQSNKKGLLPMAATTAAPLNAKPAQSEERKKQHLPPKSYVDAVEETVPSEGSNGLKDANDSNGTSKINGANGVGDDGASVLRIVDPGAPETKETQAERPELERQESKHEYSATVCSLSVLAHLTSTYHRKRASTIPRELLHDTNIEKLDPKVALDHRIS